MLLVACLLAGGCATAPEDAEPITWSAAWFQCDGSFDCIAVYDAYCKYTAVNVRYALLYQDWARQQLAELDELLPCEAPADELPHAAYCRRNRCANP